MKRTANIALRFDLDVPDLDPELDYDPWDLTDDQWARKLAWMQAVADALQTAVDRLTNGPVVLAQFLGAYENGRLEYSSRPSDERD